MLLLCIGDVLVTFGGLSWEVQSATRIEKGDYDGSGGGGDVLATVCIDLSRRWEGVGVVGSYFSFSRLRFFTSSYFD